MVGDWISFGISFLLISLITALITALARFGDARTIWRETRHFFLTLVVGIAIFCLVVFGLEWIFIRPPI